MRKEEEEEESFPVEGETQKPKWLEDSILGLIMSPLRWINKLCDELHWSFVIAVITVYGISQGLSIGLSRVSTQYYMKDEQKVQPSEAQVFLGIVRIPWIVKPLWGFLTDLVPVFGYRRRPYFIVAGCLGVMAMLFLSLVQGLHVVPAMLCLMAGSAGIAIADVTIDACITEKSGSHPSLAGDMQSLCGLSSSIGALVGYITSGFLIHLVGSKCIVDLLGPMSRPVGSKSLSDPEGLQQVSDKFYEAGKAMWMGIKCPSVWKPCLYMYLSLALNAHIHEGLFYWYTDAKEGPLFSKLLHGASGMLDLVLVLRVNLKLHIPDFLFIVIDEGISHMIGRIKWMPLLVLSSKLCPPGVEGMFFALLMSIDHVGMLTSSWAGGILLHALGVTRTQFNNLWIAILIRNTLRISPIFLLFLVPRSDPNLPVLPPEMSKEKNDPENIELAPLVDSH
ncbi:hypothetical protein Cgig2_007654 [Carnegiea gigantea]|uniref:Folate-biopterin transporter 3 n=1 Tax=Carnegiea gigantea TaxID=171969 RepID=A0A9Q1GVZ9_9CARY|nr:hypothetical protein Cgig2_007654 [Carnegiea gigantea]